MSILIVHYYPVMPDNIIAAKLADIVENISRGWGLDPHVYFRVRHCPKFRDVDANSRGDEPESSLFVNYRG